MYSAKLSSKYQISIPKPIREELHFKAGQRFIFVKKGNIVMLVPQIQMNDLKGVMQGANTENYRDRKDRI